MRHESVATSPGAHLALRHAAARSDLCERRQQPGVFCTAQQLSSEQAARPWRIAWRSRALSLSGCTILARQQTKAQWRVRDQRDAQLVAHLLGAALIIQVGEQRELRLRDPSICPGDTRESPLKDSFWAERACVCMHGERTCSVEMGTPRAVIRRWTLRSDLGPKLDRPTPRMSPSSYASHSPASNASSWKPKP